MIPEFYDAVGFRELLDPAMDIAERGDRDEATEYTRRYVDYLMSKHNKTEVDARADIMTNLGYYAGYYGGATQQAVLDVFGAAHPFFGTDMPSAEEAYDAGRAWASMPEENSR